MFGIAWSIVTSVLGAIALNFIVRTIVFTTLKHFGAYDPRWDEKWPRFPWRPLWLGWLKFKDWKEENFSGGRASAGKAGALTQLALQYKSGTSLAGHVRLPFGIPHYSLIGELSERHKVYLASARSGKSLQLETEIALLPDDASAVLTDPKGTITQTVLYPLETRGHDLCVCDLKDPDKNLIVSLPAPVGDMRTTLRPWIGAIISLSLAVMEWIPGDLKTKTRFIIEEAQAIGEAALPGLGDTAALMAGLGVEPERDGHSQRRSGQRLRHGLGRQSLERHGGQRRGSAPHHPFASSSLHDFDDQSAGLSP